MTLEQYIQFLKNDGPMPIMGIDLAFNINKIHDLSKKISKEKDENMHGRTKKTEIETMDTTSKVVKENIDKLEDQTKKVEESLEKLDKEFDTTNQ